MSERFEDRLIIETDKYSALFTPSPLETALDAQLQRKFYTALLEPTVNQYGHLVRVSYPIFVNEGLVFFQYNRFDILKSHGLLVAAALKQQTMTPEEIEKADPEAYEIEMVEDAVRQRLLKRDGVIDSRRALNDPTYYVEGTRVTQWPELFQFAIFQRGNQFNEHIPYAHLGYYGRVKGRRPDIYATLRIAPAFEGVDYIYHVESENKLTIYHPKIYYDISRAFQEVYLPDSIKQDGRFAADEINLFPLAEPLTHPVFPDQKSQEILMGRLISLVAKLCRLSGDSI